MILCFYSLVNAIDTSLIICYDKGVVLRQSLVVFLIALGRSGPMETMPEHHL